MLLLIFVSGLSILVIFQIQKNFNRAFLKEVEKLKQIENNYEILERRRQDLKIQKELLDRDYQNISTLYEVTKNISKTLNKEDVFKEFCRVLKSLMNIEDCILFTKTEAQKELPGYFIFPLNIGQENIGTIAVKGLSAEDKDKFLILANQFALVLRRAELYQTVQELSVTDSLTQALVRRYCLQRLSEEFLRCRQKNLNLSCLIFDIDDFKRYNDKFGHLVGDIVLRDVSRTVKGNIREIDLLGRFGGEEFLLVLPETDKKSALFAAERIRKAIEEMTIKAYDEELQVSISIGIATFPEDAQQMSDLIDKADKALYQAKKAGKNRACLYSTG